ncbi:unnamed protein product [Ascophyllum nodosum]
MLRGGSRQLGGWRKLRLVLRILPAGGVLEFAYRWGEEGTSLGFRLRQL